MADTRDEWRAERGGERANGPNGPIAGWFDDRGVSEVIGSILVFGLLISLLAIVQTQAVPDANNEVEVKHNADVQGDISGLQAAISRTGQFGKTESTTVRTGMTYPSRLVLYNPPAVQGTLATSDDSPVELDGFSAPEPDTDEYLTSDPVFESATVSYRVDYNRYDNAPTTRYEYGAIIDEYEDEDKLVVESQDTLVSGRYISLTLLNDSLQASQVRPASVTTYPVSAPAQSTTVTSGSNPARITVPTDIPAEVWVTELLADQIDDNALQGSPSTDCDSLNQATPNARVNPDDDDGNYVVDCEYTENSNGPNELELFFERDEKYNLRLSKVAFTTLDEPEPFYVTDVSPENSDDLVVEVRDQYNNPIGRQVDLKLATTDGSGNIKNTEPVDTGPNGRFQVPEVKEDAFLYLQEGPNKQPAPSAPCTGLGCASVDPPGLPASSLIRVTDVSGDENADTITFSFNNQGERDTNISEVQLGYATQRDERTLTVAVGQVTECGLSDLLSDCLTSETLTTTLVDDGPNEIETLSSGGTTFQPDAPTGAQENFAPVAFDTNGQATDGVPPILASQTTSDVTFALDESIELSGTNSVDISVTVYYEDGSVATYSRTLYNEAGDQGQ